MDNSFILIICLRWMFVWSLLCDIYYYYIYTANIFIEIVYTATRIE